ncbi:hypothetical protein SKAU_G00196560 [Synaphobranchus kaupii]|uniref:Uncharacterized protein n=1 Tax=Synaphobranchus kaupii TaxID=118154 RepID=A0A9Q1FEM3_SYNKA|nr:hypothetical protein SKAU_G00196560 [Synaphobranchus kaupii]
MPFPVLLSIIWPRGYQASINKRAPVPVWGWSHVLSCPLHRWLCTTFHLLNVTALDLVDLSEPNEKRKRKEKKSPLMSHGESPRCAHHKNKSEETDRIQVDMKHATLHLQNLPMSVDSVNIPPSLEKWEEVNLHPERSGSRKWKWERKCSSIHSSSELLWSTEYKSDSVTKNTLEVNTHVEVETSPVSQCQVAKQPRWRRPFLSRNHSLEEEFERAKAAVEQRLGWNQLRTGVGDQGQERTGTGAGPAGRCQRGGCRGAMDSAGCRRQEQVGTDTGDRGQGQALKTGRYRRFRQGVSDRSRGTVVGAGARGQAYSLGGVRNRSGTTGGSLGGNGGGLGGTREPG